MSSVGFPVRERVEQEQLAALRTLVSRLVPDNRFYTRKWAEAKVSTPPASLAEFSETFPFTTKAELVADQTDHPPYGTNLTFPPAAYTRFTQTSGTTGTPLRWLDTTESWTWMVGNWVRVLERSGIDQHDRIFFAFSFGPFLGFWTAFEAGIQAGALCLPGGGMSSAGRLRAILDNEVTALCCTPTYALHLGEVAAAEGIDLSRSRVRTILAAGEPGASIPATRARIQALWPGSRVRDHHGMTEIGPVTYECPEREGVLHVIEGSYYPEVIDPGTGRPLERGARGELVLTGLGRTGSPLLRYRTGDVVLTGAEPVCRCGTAELALLGGIIGRSDDMVVVRGVNLYPSAVEEVLRRFPEVAEYRVEVRRVNALAEAALQVEPVTGVVDPKGLCTTVQGALREAFNLRIPVQPAPPGSLPRWELKARRWIHTDD